MITIGALFVFGVLLLMAEVILPGGIIGIFGGLSLLAGVVMAFVDFGSAVGGGALLVALALAGIAMYAEFTWLPKSRLMGKMAVRAKSAERTHAHLDGAAASIGRDGVAETMLSPSGYVRVGDQRFEAFCRSGQINPGTAIKVVGVDTFRLIVTETTSSL